MNETTAKKQTLGFQAEVKQLLHLVAHSLYSHKDIFLRELISNSADAIEKLRCAALSDSSLYEDAPDPKIWVDVDKERKCLTITDNGIGMSLEEARDNLGTIAQSGTRNFMDELSSAKSGDDASSLIGQFGVGFYSAFIVADKVSVISRKAGFPKEAGVRWQSDGEGEFTLETVNRQQRGTEITLHLREEQLEFLEEYRLREIIKRYSDHIATPILMHPLTTGNEKEQEKIVEYETVNQAKALWTKQKNDITQEEYEQFYEYFAHAMDKPLAWSHNRVEGKLEYISLLYIPSQAPFDLWHREFQRGLKLYVQRVFIMDKAEELLPMYLRFVRGVIDSNDLPLNISRELLQQNAVIDKIRNACAKKVLSLLEKLSNNEPEKYTTFWTQFGNVLKEGVAEDHSNKETIAKLLRFTSTHEDTPEQKVTFAQYQERMKEKQEKIYYLLADSYETAKSNPHLEIFRKKGIEVLLLTDAVDEWVVMHLNEFDGKPLQSITQGEMDDMEEEEADAAPEAKKAQEEQEKAYTDTLAGLKEALGDTVKEVRLSKRLTDSPSCVVQDEQAIPKHMQQMFAAAGQAMPETKPTLEINPDHVMVKGLQSKEKGALTDWAHYLLNQAIIAEGGKVANPADFVKRMNRLLVGE